MKLNQHCDAKFSFKLSALYCALISLERIPHECLTTMGLQMQQLKKFHLR